MSNEEKSRLRVSNAAVQMLVSIMDNGLSPLEAHKACVLFTRRMLRATSRLYDEPIETLSENYVRALSAAMKLETE